MLPFGLPLTYGQASRGECKWPSLWDSPIVPTCMLGLRLDLLSSTLIPISLACSSLRLLPFFCLNKSADDVVSAINEGDTKQFFKSVNDVLKVANNKTAAPKCLRVIDSVTGCPRRE